MGVNDKDMNPLYEGVTESVLSCIGTSVAKRLLATRSLLLPSRDESWTGATNSVDGSDGVTSIGCESPSPRRPLGIKDKDRSPLHEEGVTESVLSCMGTSVVKRRLGRGLLLPSRNKSWGCTISSVDVSDRVTSIYSKK